MSQSRTTIAPINDIAEQARQGSVAAIIQLLNDRLAEDGIRTRAVREDGILQLLCEAAHAEQLEQPSLVKRIQQILEEIGPQDVRRVKVNSRIVREQQLLWLEEISRDPEQQLLWQEEIKLSQRNPLTQLVASFKARSVHPSKRPLPKPSSGNPGRAQRQFKQGIASGVCLSLCLFGVGWLLLERLGSGAADPSQAQTSAASVIQAEPQRLPAGQTPRPEDPFVVAVRLAEQAAQGGLTAQTSAQWLALAAQWQQASDLMGQVPTTDNRYKTAQDRATLYRQHREAVLKKVETRRPQAQP